VIAECDMDFGGPSLVGIPVMVSESRCDAGL
jgi:hypothetical protein